MRLNARRGSEQYHSTKSVMASDGVVIAPLTAPRREAVQDCRFRLFEVGKGQDSLRWPFSSFGISGIWRRPP